MAFIYDMNTHSVGWQRETQLVCYSMAGVEISPRAYFAVSVAISVLALIVVVI